jgi:hypothetical protein
VGFFMPKSFLKEGKALLTGTDGIVVVVVDVVVVLCRGGLQGVLS